PAVALRTTASGDRAACMARRAELSGDPDRADEAIGVLKDELRDLAPAKEPVAWATCQVNLARLYETRARARGEPGEEVASAILALSAALDVFDEHGLRALAHDAARMLE